MPEGKYEGWAVVISVVAVAVAFGGYVIQNKALDKQKDQLATEQTSLRVLQKQYRDSGAVFTVTTTINPLPAKSGAAFYGNFQAGSTVDSKSLSQGIGPCGRSPP